MIRQPKEVRKKFWDYKSHSTAENFAPALVGATSFGQLAIASTI
jgi:hypothetical protein